MGILELRNLLEFVNTNNDIATFFLSDFSDSWRISSILSVLGFISKDMENSVIGSGPIETL